MVQLGLSSYSPFRYLPLLIIGFMGALSMGYSQQLNSPFLDVFPKEVYGYGVPNWKIQQTQDGLIYTANNEGLLEYDGYQWNLYPIPNRTIVRDILLQGDSIFAGGQNEMGYFKRDRQQKWTFISLRSLIPEEHRSFEDVWNLTSVTNKISFRSSKKIYTFQNGQFEVLDHEQYLFLGKLDDKIILHTRSGKLIQRASNQERVILQSDLLKEILIRSIIKNGADTLVATYKRGIWQIKNGGLSKWQAQDPEIRNLSFLNHLERFPDGSLGIASNFHGFYHTDQQGKILHQVGKKNGLPTNGVIIAFRDNQKNLWLGLENGLALLHLNQPIQEIDLTKEDFGPAYDLVDHQGYIYVGTNQGLYRGEKRKGFRADNLNLIPGTQGQVWGLDVIGERLFMSHNDGLFLIQNKQAIPVFTDVGCWLVQEYQQSKDTLVVGSYQGIHLLDINASQPLHTIENLQESSRFLVQDAQGDIWMSHPYRGVFRVVNAGRENETVHFYDQEKGLPAVLNNHVFLVRNLVMVASNEKVYHYDRLNDRFIPSTSINTYLATDQKIRRLKELDNGNIWFISDNEVGYLKKVSVGLEQHFEKITLPHLKRYMNNGWEKIFHLNEQGIFLTSIKGLLQYQTSKKKLKNDTYPVLLESLLINNDSTIYPIQDSKEQYQFSPRDKTLAFRVAAIDYTENRSILYQYKLKGWDENWTPATEKRIKEYTNLPYGSYELEVRAQTRDGKNYPPFSFPFVISKPWYLSFVAILCYILLGTLLLGAIAYSISQRFTTLKQEFSSTVNKSNEQIRRLENIRMQAELDHKKRELVSTTMHITKQNETINSLKKMLADLKKEVREPQTGRKINKILNYLKQEKRADENWDQLLFHFKELHPSFFDRLKNEHPELKPKDLKLCAYLKLNLSTKEMATLMNISIRGIEASRYRLRKRLGIDSEINLNEYFMNY